MKTTIKVLVEYELEYENESNLPYLKRRARELPISVSGGGSNGSYEIKRKSVEIIESIKPKFGCHIDLMDGQTPDDCVLDIGRADECSQAPNAEALGGKEHCRYWREIK